MDYDGASVKCNDVSKTYRSRNSEVVALDRINLEVRTGEFVALLGPSGCGKSTLLKIIAGLLPKSSGNILVRNEEVRGPIKDVGVVFQSAALLPWRTALGNLKLVGEVLHLDQKDCVQRAHHLLELVGLKGFENSYPHELSGGMQQRLSLARALLHDPSLLLMDEPFGALDAFTREEMGLELLRIWSKAVAEGQSKTVVFVTHDISEAVFLSDRVIVLTPRPGRLKSVVEVDIPRPRDLKVKSSGEYAACTLHLRKEFGLV